MKLLSTLIIVLAFAGVAAAQHDMQHANAAMGFDQNAATHHFLLAKDGGAIVITAKDAADTMTLQHVRAHLREISDAFGRGDFAKPFAVHDEVPPGVPALTEHKQSLKYRYEDRAAGGAVVISTADAVALNALHEFLRYQIVEHKTGDPLTVK